MTSTLYLNLDTYPLPYGSTAKVHADIWLASHFLNDPSGVSQPPQGATADGTTGTVTIAFGGTAATIAGLDNTKAYWLRVFSPQGYTHWFPVNWTTGNSSGSPLFVRVPAIEGPVLAGATTVSTGSTMVIQALATFDVGEALAQSGVTDGWGYMRATLTQTPLVIPSGSTEAVNIPTQCIYVTPVPASSITIQILQVLVCSPDGTEMLVLQGTFGDALIDEGPSGTSETYSIPDATWSPTFRKGTDLSWSASGNALSITSAVGAGAIYGWTWTIAVG